MIADLRKETILKEAADGCSRRQVGRILTWNGACAAVSAVLYGVMHYA